MTPLVIIAHLATQGYVSRDRLSPCIDGILAYAYQRRLLTPEEFIDGAAAASELKPVEGLPLGVERFGGDWWYQCSIKEMVDFHGRELKKIHRRFDDHLDRYLDANVGKVLTAAGPFKNSRLTDTRTVCRALRWRAIGDKAGVEDLLRDIPAVGGRRGIGHGVVSRWEVVVGDDDDAHAARFNRPLPVEFAEQHDVTGPEMVWGYKPPARAQACMGRCIVPGGARHADR